MNTVLFMNALKEHLKKLDTTDVPHVLLPFYVKLLSNWLLFFLFLNIKTVLQPLISNILKTEVLIMLLFFLE